MVEIKPVDILRLIEKHGNITLSELLVKLQGDRIHVCPKCNGIGGKYSLKLSQINKYFHKHNIAIFEECNLCNGHCGFDKKIFEEMKGKFYE